MTNRLEELDGRHILWFGSQCYHWIFSRKTKHHHNGQYLQENLLLLPQNSCRVSPWRGCGPKNCGRGKSSPQMPRAKGGQLPRSLLAALRFCLSFQSLWKRDLRIQGWRVHEAAGTVQPNPTAQVCQGWTRSKTQEWPLQDAGCSERKKEAHLRIKLQHLSQGSPLGECPPAVRRMHDWSRWDLNF